MVEHPRGEGDRRVRQAVQRLRAAGSPPSRRRCPWGRGRAAARRHGVRRRTGRPGLEHPPPAPGRRRGKCMPTPRQALGGGHDRGSLRRQVYEDIASAFRGPPRGEPDPGRGPGENITMTWVTNTGISPGHRPRRRERGRGPCRIPVTALNLVAVVELGVGGVGAHHRADADSSGHFSETQLGQDSAISVAVTPPPGDDQTRHGTRVATRVTEPTIGPSNRRLARSLAGRSGPPASPAGRGRPGPA